MKIHCDTVLYSVTECAGVTTREIELMMEETKTKTRRLNGFIWENDNKCCKMSHFFFAAADAASTAAATASLTRSFGLRA